MRAFDIDIPEGSQPLYLRIANSVREALRQGVLLEGTLLPSTRDIARQLQVHRHTVTRGLEELVAEGWLEPEAGRGYRILAKGTGDLEALSVEWPEFPLAQQLGHSQDGLYDFPSGKPDLRLFPTDEFFRELRNTLRTIPPETLLGYSDPAGCAAFHQELKSYLARMRGLTRGEVLVTHGSQEAIFLLGQLLTRNSRRRIFVEELGYPPAWDALRMSGAELVGIPVDEQGLRVDILEDLVREEPPALLYLTPLHQYPTTVTLSLERRQRLLQVIAEWNIPVIEDDYDHEFHYQGRPTRPLAGDDQSGLVMYVSTFSKLVYPSSRIGFCLVPEELLEPLTRLKRSVTRQNDLLLQFTMAHWMHAGGLDRHLRKMRKAYGQRMLVMTKRLQEMGLAHSVPKGGMSVWVDLGADYRGVLERCSQAGLKLRPGAFYQLRERSELLRYVRLGFACYTPEEIERGLDVLERASRGGFSLGMSEATVRGV